MMPHAHDDRARSRAGKFRRGKAIQASSVLQRGHETVGQQGDRKEDHVFWGCPKGEVSVRGRGTALGGFCSSAPFTRLRRAGRGRPNRTH